MKLATIAIAIILLAGCACLPKPLPIDDLELGTHIDRILELDEEPYSRTEIREPGLVITELRYVGGTVLTFRNDALVKIEGKQ